MRLARWFWHATDVSIACTAGDLASALANPADASFSLSTNVPAGTETPNAATGTRNRPVPWSRRETRIRIWTSVTTLGGYIFNLSTSELGTGTYNLTFTAGNDPVPHSVSFQVK